MLYVTINVVYICRKDKVNNMETTTIITKTNFTRGDDCPLSTAYSLINPKASSSPDINYILDNGHKVGEFARKLITGGELVKLGYREDMASATRELIEQGVQTIYEAAFLHDGLFAAIDILHFTSQNHVELYEVKSSTKIEDIFYKDIAFQTNLVKSSGLIIDKAYLITVNGEFIKNGEIDPNLYFDIIDVTDDAFSLEDTVKKEIEDIRNLLENEDLSNINPPFGTHCFSPYFCQYWNLCKATLPEKSIFDIKGGMKISTKLKHFYNDTKDMKSFLKLKRQNPKFVQQARIEVEESDEIEVKMEELKGFLETIQYPMISLDFETILPAIPIFDGMKPYDQSVTQYSMHVLRSVGEKLEHFEFLANPHEDWRGKLAHNLVKNCPKEGSVLVWNKTMEYHRLMELAEMDCNSDIKDEIVSIAERIVDLMVPFRNRVIYNRPMHGSYSLKHVLPALCPNDKDLNYSDLSINNGMLASMAFTEMMDEKMSDIQESSTRRDLLTYCELDTFGPFNILDVMYHLADSEAPKLFVKSEKHDQTNRILHVGDRVSTNMGLGIVTGYTPCFVRVLCDNHIKILRKAHNIYNLTGLKISETDKPVNRDLGSLIFYDVTGREVQNGDFVVTKSKIGKVIGHTNSFLKILLCDGTVVLRNGTFTIIS